MDLLNKIKNYIDYNNQYSMRKALTTLNKEFEIAVIRKNIIYAKYVIEVTKKIYEDFGKTYRESEDYGETMSYSQRILAQKMRHFISYLIKQLKTKFGCFDLPEQQIEKTISNEE